MNLRNVLRAYSLLRQLSDDESALLNILRTLNDSDREALVVSMSDKPSQKKLRPQSEKCGVCNMTRMTPVHSDKRYTDYHEFEKKSSKKAAGKGGKSRRGLPLQSMKDAASDPRTITDRCGVCGNDEDYADHFKPSPHYHPFQSPASTAVAAGAGIQSASEGPLP